MTRQHPDGIPGCYIPTKHRPPLPDSVREEVCKRAGGNCECCGEKCRGELHHTTYEWLYSDADYTTANYLQFLCRNCHMAAHTWMGFFYADIDELNGEQDYYYHMTEKDD